VKTRVTGVMAIALFYQVTFGKSTLAALSTKKNLSGIYNTLHLNVKRKVVQLYIHHLYQG
jgi:hypothetical protein